MSELATIESHGSALTLEADQTFWTEHQIAALRQMGLDQAGNGDLAVFMHVSQRTGLDPFAKQIYMIGRWSKDGTKYTIQTGIDGFRLIARRASDRLGETLEYEDTLWCDADGNWTDVWTKATAPAAAKVTVLRHGKRFPAVAVYREYVQTVKSGDPNQMWGRMPANQLAKCAEALALRKAFPQDLSGIYADEEMGQADRPERREPAARLDAVLTQSSPPETSQGSGTTGSGGTPTVDSPGGESASDDEPLTNRTKFGKHFYARVAERKFETDQARLEYIVETIGRFIESTKEMTNAEARRVLDRFDEEDGVTDGEIVEPGA